MSDTKDSTYLVTGTVVSAKMRKTISVRVERRVSHPVYGKYIKRSTKLLAHDQNNECHEGDVVVIGSTRPYSKKKAYKLSKILERAK